MVITWRIDDEILECLNEIHRLRKRAWKQAPYTMEMFYAADKTNSRITELKNKVEKLRIEKENALVQYRTDFYGNNSGK